jgi:hypothetical protein
VSWDSNVATAANAEAELIGAPIRRPLCAPMKSEPGPPMNKQGYVPPGVVNWNDADDNNAFHAKLIVMDFDGSLSTEVALYKKLSIRRRRNTTTS